MSPGALGAAAPAPEAAPPRAVLGVARSATGRAWRWRDADERAVRAIAVRHDLPEIAARLIAARGIGQEAVPSFLAPTLRESLPDPSCLADMDRAVARLADAVMAGERVAVLADYDVDGATSAAQLIRSLRELGLEPGLHVPDRLAEGYGPNPEALARLAGEGASLIVTVDCGVASAPAFEAVRGRADVIVLDHHPAPEALPDVHAVVDPARPDDASGLHHLAAAGVVFMTLVALARELRRRGAFKSRAEPDLMRLLGLVALGTVCDVVPLVGLNRAFVVQGLKVLAQRDIAGLAALAEAARAYERPSVHQLGFVLGPRINAGGRIGRADLGCRLLLSEEPGEAQGLALELDRLNEERQATESACLDEAEAQIAASGWPDGRALLLVASARFHPGVVGLVAARLTERYRRPSAAIAIGPDGTARGSARSIGGVDLGAAVRAAVTEGLLAKGGGHAMAAGFTLADGNLDALGSFLEARLGPQVAAALAEQALRIDATLTAGGAGEELMGWIDRIGPFGRGHPAPVFAFPAHAVTFADTVGRGHVRLGLRSGDGTRLDAIAFRAAGTPLAELLLGSRDMPLHVAGRLKREHWNGRASIRLIVEDAARPG